MVRRPCVGATELWRVLYRIEESVERSDASGDFLFGCFDICANGCGIPDVLGLCDNNRVPRSAKGVGASSESSGIIRNAI